MSYDYSSTRHDDSHAYLYPSVSALLTDVPAGATVLDLGCGNGSFLAYFRDLGWNLFGTDSSVTGIAIAQQAYPDIRFFTADAEHAESQILAESGLVDVILSTEVVEHIYDPRAFIRTCSAVLKPGGRLILTTPYHGYWKNLALAITGKFDRHFTALWDNGHIKFWSRATLTQLTQEAGFEVVAFRGSGRIPYLWASMILVVRKPAA